MVAEYRERTPRLGMRVIPLTFMREPSLGDLLTRPTFSPGILTVYAAQCLSKQQLHILVNWSARGYVPGRLESAIVGAHPGVRASSTTSSTCHYSLRPGRFPVAFFSSFDCDSGHRKFSCLWQRSSRPTASRRRPPRLSVRDSSSPN